MSDPNENNWPVPLRIPPPCPPSPGHHPLGEDPEEHEPIAALVGAIEAILRQPHRVRCQLRHPGAGRLILAMLCVSIITTECGTLAGTSSDGRDYLIGWYHLPNRHYSTRKITPGPGCLIPVSKRDGGYYSISRGIEIPLKECPEGLEWGLTNSSMKGTKIGLDAASKEPYIILEDSNAQFEGGISTNGEKQFMTKTNKPSGLLDPTAKPPQTKGDFVGCYLPAYFPAYRWIVTKDGDKYHLEGQTARKNGWKTEQRESATLKPLTDKLGFAWDGERQIRLVFNHNLKRYECLLGPDNGSLTMPIVRVSPSLPPGTGAGTALIGIPAWH